MAFWPAAAVPRACCLSQPPIFWCAARAQTKSLRETAFGCYVCIELISHLDDAHINIPTSSLSIRPRILPFTVSSVSQALRENMPKKCFFYFPTGRFILVSVSIRNTCACRFCFLRNTEKISFLESCLSFEKQKGLYTLVPRQNQRSSEFTTHDIRSTDRDTRHPSPPHRFCTEAWGSTADAGEACKVRFSAGGRRSSIDTCHLPQDG